MINIKIYIKVINFNKDINLEKFSFSFGLYFLFNLF